MEKHSVLKPIHKLYNKLTYWDSYGTHVVISILTISVFLWFTSYYYILNNLEPIKTDWVNQRCNPIVMPFAGIINKPPNKTNIEFTGENFTFCTQNIIKNFAGYVTKPISYASFVLSQFFLMILKVLNSIRKMLSKMREQLASIAKVIFSRILNIVISLQEFFIYLRDIFAKTIGILTSGFYVLLGSYFTLKSSIGALFEAIVIILFILIGMIIPLWVIPITYPMAAVLTGVFLAIALPLGIIAIIMNQVMGTTLSGIPKVPKCFDSHTKLNENIKIKDVKIGTCIDDSIVTSKIKLSSKQEKLYNVNGIQVTGNHKIYQNDKLINVKDYEKAELVNRDHFELYSINTNSKHIKLNNIYFTDYDEMTANEILKLRHIFKNETNIKPKTLDFIHHYFDGGFHKDTWIKLIDGRYKNICDITCDDVLEDLVNVIGVVEIKSDDLYHSLVYDEKDNICASKNVTFTHLGKSKNMNQITDKVFDSEISVLYHLITDKGYFKINDKLFNDYNYLIESYL